VFDLDAFVTDCRSALGEATPAVAVKELVERAISRPSDLDDALTPPTRGGFRTLHRSAELTVLQFVWPPHVVLFPHDHRSTGVPAAGSACRAGGASTPATSPCSAPTPSTP
jgi:predicted metal-dependent enzyme (double-stranded beta helix superfamily)